MHLKTIAFGAGVLTGVGLIAMYKPAMKLMNQMKSSLEDYMQNHKINMGCCCASEQEEKTCKCDNEVIDIAREMFEDIQSIDMNELSSNYKKILSKIKKSVLAILELNE